MRETDSGWRVRIQMSFHGHKAGGLRSRLKTMLKKSKVNYSGENTFIGQDLTPEHVWQSLQVVTSMFEKPTKEVPATKNRLCADVNNLSIQIKKPFAVWP